MLNTLRAELIKLKGTKFYLVYLLSIVAFSALYVFLYYYFAPNFTLKEIFRNILNFNENLTIYSAYLYLFLIFIVAILTDIICRVDGKKWDILYTKNIRVGYFWSKFVILLLFVFFLLFIASIAVGGYLYLCVSQLDVDLLLQIYLDLIFRFVILYIALIPIILIFLFTGLFLFRASILAILIVIFQLSNPYIKTHFQNYDIVKSGIDTINDTTFLGNYRNILDSVLYNIDDTQLYETILMDEKYGDKDLLDRYDELSKLDIVNKIFSSDKTIFYIEIRDIFENYGFNLSDTLESISNESMTDDMMISLADIKIIPQIFEYESVPNRKNQTQELILRNRKDRYIDLYTVAQFVESQGYSPAYIQVVESRINSSKLELKSELQDIDGDTLLEQLDHYFMSRDISIDDIDDEFIFIKKDVTRSYIYHHTKYIEVLKYFFNIQNRDFIIWMMYILILSILPKYFIKDRMD